MKLYSYRRSTTSYRVRAALNLKGMVYETVPVDLAAEDQHAPDYIALNPGAGVPTLVLDDGTVLTQSLAILEYVDATWPTPRLIPQDVRQRARVMAVAHTVASDIHPVNNLRVIGQLKERFGATAAQTQAWMCHWMTQGFDAVEKQVQAETSFAFGHHPGLADLCIVAQVYNARRRALDMTPYPKVARIEANALNVPAIAAAHPDRQPDAQQAV